MALNMFLHMKIKMEIGCSWAMFLGGKLFLLVINY